MDILQLIHVHVSVFLHSTLGGEVAVIIVAFVVFGSCIVSRQVVLLKLEFVFSLGGKICCPDHSLQHNKHCTCITTQISFCEQCLVPIGNLQTSILSPYIPCLTIYCCATIIQQLSHHTLFTPNLMPHHLWIEPCKLTTSLSLYILPKVARSKRLRTNAGVDWFPPSSFHWVCQHLDIIADHENTLQLQGLAKKVFGNSSFSY